jgi:NAD(P)-dependent dehydrogenase (short-subunit alcohol dehydrogenase family)
VIDVNLWGVIYGCKTFLPSMIDHDEGGHIVNTASMAGLGSAPLMGAYSVSKHGVVALSETLAKEMAMMQTGVGVSVLCPAFVQTAIGSSRRNMPDSLKSDVARAASAAQSAIDRRIAAGMPAESVAEIVHDAVTGDHFWILTHEESKPAVTERARQIVEGINPDLTGLV